MEKRARQVNEVVDSGRNECSIPIVSPCAGHFHDWRSIERAVHGRSPVRRVHGSFSHELYGAFN